MGIVIKLLFASMESGWALIIMKQQNVNLWCGMDRNDRTGSTTYLMGILYKMAKNMVFYP